jgi:hypothetical protein
MDDSVSDLIIEEGREYYWKRSGGWDWTRLDTGEVEKRWWEITAEITGINGLGGGEGRRARGAEAPREQ